jgi:hypothetical protein
MPDSTAPSLDWDWYPPLPENCPSPNSRFERRNDVGQRKQIKLQRIRGIRFGGICVPPSSDDPLGEYALPIISIMIGMKPLHKPTKMLAHCAARAARAYPQRSVAVASGRKEDLL